MSDDYSRRGGRTLTLLGVFFVGFALCGACVIAQQPASTVRVVINYGDGVEKHFTAIPWREEMTVLDAMRAAAEHRRGVKFEYRGSGATAFLTQIDEVKNEGNGRNWMYRVNGKLAERGFAVQRLERGDAVLWTFEKSR